MRVLRDTNTSQNSNGNIRITKLQAPGTVVQRTNVSQYSGAGVDLQDLESAKKWAEVAKEHAQDAHDSAERSSDFADFAKNSSLDAEQSATNAEASNNRAEQWAKYSENQANLSEASADASALSAEKALGHEINAETALASTIVARDKTIEYRDAASSSAGAAKESARLSEESNIEAEGHKNTAYQWAEGYPTNSSKYWAEQAMTAAAAAVVSGGTWTPQDGNEYPNTTGATVNTMYFVQFPDEFGTHTFATGQLAGKTTSPQDIMFWEVAPKSKWSLIRSPLSNSVMEINGKSGNVITLVPSDLGAYTTGQVDEAIRTRVPMTRMVNGKALDVDISLGSADVGAYSKMEANDLLLLKVDKTITVNGYALANDVVLNYNDVGARPNTWFPNINEIDGTVDFGTF